MYLDAVSAPIEAFTTETIVTMPKAAREAPYAPWQDWPPAHVSHHGDACCEIARDWIVATDYGALAGDSVLTGPRWICSRFKWGASSYPVTWCEAVRRDELDCGVLAAFAHAAFSARGVESYRVQLVQRFSVLSAKQWRRSWDAADQTDWIGDETIYHEGCGVVVGDGELKIWDASAGWWLEPGGSGYGKVIAARIVAPAGNASYEWCGRTVETNVWEEFG